MPILEEATTPGRTDWLYEHFPVFPIPIPGITAIRTENYKYLEYVMICGHANSST